MSRHSNNRNFAILTAFSLSEKLIAFIYQALLASVLGAHAITDCYFSASQLFDLIDSTVLGALVVVVINRYAYITAENGESAGLSFLSNLNSLLSFIMIILSISAFIFANPISYLIAPGFDNKMRIELVRCIRILCIIPPIMVYATLAQGVLRLKKRFVLVNSRSLCISLCGMLIILVNYMYGFKNSIALCIGYIAANLFFTFFLYLGTKQYGSIKLTRPRLNSEIKELVKISIPAIISSGIVRVSMMIDQIISSTLGEGKVSYLTYSQSLYNIVNSLFIFNLCMIILTDLTNLCVKSKYDEMIEKAHNAINLTTIILVPITLISICFSKEIVAIVYERGSFDYKSTQAVGNLLFYYSLGFIPAMLNSVHTQILHAFGKMKIAMIISILSFCINIFLSILLSHYLGMIGIAIGTSISAMLVVEIYKQTVKKYLPAYKTIWTIEFTGKLTLGIMACAGSIYISKQIISSNTVALVIGSIISSIIYIVILYYLREKTVVNYLGSVVYKIKNIKHKI